MTLSISFSVVLVSCRFSESLDFEIGFDLIDFRIVFACLDELGLTDAA